ncbi:MAG: hypothetical protein AAGD43_09095, partial [Pseudomonadota bacterium]
MAENGSLEDDIETSVWIDPKSGEDHSITVMRCGDNWWSYVDTTRISEDCTSKEAAVEFAKAHLVERYKDGPPEPVIASAAKTSQKETITPVGSRRALIWFTAIIAGGAIAAMAFVNRDVATDLMSSFAVAETDAAGSQAPVITSPPLPKRNKLDTASLKTGSVSSRVKSVAVSSYQPTAVSTAPAGKTLDAVGQSAASHNRDVRIDYHQYSRSRDRLQQYDKPDAASDQVDEPTTKTETGETVRGAAIVTSAGSGLAARSLPGSYARTLNTPPQLKKKQSAKRPAGRSSKRKARRKTKRRYRGRRMVSVRRVRIGNRVVKIVRFRR